MENIAPLCFGEKKRFLNHGHDLDDFMSWGYGLHHVKWGYGLHQDVDT